MSEPQLKEPSPEDEAELSVKPLDNSVIFDDNLSVAIAKIERESNTATVWLAFRRIAEQWHISKRGFKLRIIDDRQNKYEKYFHVWGRGIYTPRYGPLHLEGLPCGFTWVIPIEITRISSIAPVSKIEIERDFWNWLDKGDKPKKVCFELDFANPTFPNLEFKITPEQLLLPGDEVRLNKDISFRVGNLMLQDEFTDTPDVEKRFVFTLPLIVRNDDYNAHTMNRYALAAQFEDGRFITSDKKGWQGPKIQAQSTYTYNVKVYIGFKKDLEGIVSLPHRLILYTCNSPTAGYRFYRFVPISPELKRQCVEIKNTAVHNDSKQNQTQTHTKKEKQTKKIEKQVEEKVEKAVDSMFDRLFKKKR